MASVTLSSVRVGSVVFEVGNTYGFEYAGKVRVCKVETLKVGPSGEVVSGLTYTNEDINAEHRSFTATLIRHPYLQNEAEYGF